MKFSDHFTACLAFIYKNDKSPSHRHLCLIALSSCSMTLLRYSTRRSLHSVDKAFSFTDAAHASNKGSTIQAAMVQPENL
jgi:hypothetical protein